ncbi:MAG: hypothetical protein OXG35_28665 [Acidobacteria bacterium]|nr:hypothetical protein [Acidobacteriota bacterium]
MDDAVRRLGNDPEAVDAVECFTQRRNPERTAETTALIDSAHAVLDECAEKALRRRDSEEGTAASAPNDASGGDPEAALKHAATDALSFLAEHHRTVFVVLVTSHTTVLVYWNWNYAYTIEDNPDVRYDDGVAEPQWRDDSMLRQIHPPEAAPARYGYIVEAIAKGVEINVVGSPEPHHDPYGRLILSTVPETMREALMLARDRIDGLGWLTCGNVPDPAIRGGVHPERRALQAIGENSKGRWLTLKRLDGRSDKNDEAFVEGESAELTDELDPFTSVMTAGGLTIWALNPAAEPDASHDQHQMFKKGTLHAVFSRIGDDEVLDVFEMTETATDREVPASLMKKAVPIGRGVRKLLEDCIGA